MDVVSDAGSILSGVILAKNAEFFSFLDDDLLHEGEQIVGILIWLIPKQVRLMGSTRVEISERNDPPIRMGPGQRPKQHLHASLALTIGTSW